MFIEAEKKQLTSNLTVNPEGLRGQPPLPFAATGQLGNGASVPAIWVPKFPQYIKP